MQSFSCWLSNQAKTKAIYILHTQSCSKQVRENVRTHIIKFSTILFLFLHCQYLHSFLVIVSENHEEVVCEAEKESLQKTQEESRIL